MRPNKEQTVKKQMLQGFRGDDARRAMKEAIGLVRDVWVAFWPDAQIVGLVFISHLIVGYVSGN